MSLVGVDQDHQVVRESRIFDVGVLAVTRSLLRPLQHPVDLGEVDVTEQRRNHPALRNALLPAGFEHDLQQVHHVRIVHALSDFRQQPIVPDIVEIAAQVDVYDACLALPALSHFWIRRMMRLSPILCSRKRTNQLWLTAPKKFWMSASSIQFTFLILIAVDSASSASCGPRPGRNPYEKPQKSPS